MSLDKQRILSELGSVMNQLKSADCGCMGKLFSNQNEGQARMGAPLPTCHGCRTGCCHGHGYGQGSPYSGQGSPYSGLGAPYSGQGAPYSGQGAPHSGEPYSMGHNQNMNRPCMGFCNPPKLYSETYNYLNNNLMQPVVQEVYDDLKSINPGNTIMNNQLGNQMGLSQGNPGAMAQGNTGNMNQGNANMGTPMQNMSGMGAGNTNKMSMGQPNMNPMSGMGPQIMNMIMGDSGRKPSNIQKIPTQGGQLTPSMANAPQSSAGDSSAMNMSTGQYGANVGNMNQQGNMGGFANPPTQFVSKDNMFTTGTAQGSPMAGNMSQGMTQPGTPQTGNMNNAMGNVQMGNTNPAVQQMSATNQLQYSQPTQGMMQTPGSQQMTPTNQAQYGQHSQGIKKFNEMFPGVMQGDLGFDPMAIAIQMNPANHQQSAMTAMQRLMNGDKADLMKPVTDTTKTAMASLNSGAAQGQQSVSQVGNQQFTGQQPAPVQQTISSTPNLNQQMITPGQQQAVDPNAVQSQPQLRAVPQQQVYTAVTGQPMLNQQYQQQQLQQPQDPNQQQQYVDPSSGAVSPGHTTGQEGVIDPNAQAPPPNTQANMPEAMIREPIFPADISRNRPFHYSKPHRPSNYNTLGQPIETYPAHLFHQPDPPLPQTLSPQPRTTKSRTDYMKYSNVKSTVSKTSLAGNKPIGRTPSRSQLQHIYNQYKGSQSFTQQNVRPPAQGGSHSAGKLETPQPHAPQQVPIERVGGDTLANNQINNNQIPNKVEHVMGQLGDVPVPNKPQGDGAPVKPPSSPVPVQRAKLRNGLQDVVYTSYPTSAAWSFHGNNTYRPISVGYRYRNLK